MQNLIDAVKAHADEHYEHDGWDIVSECYEDGEIAALIGNATTPADAICAVGKHIKPLADYRADIQAEAF
jgi:hypothetical protein